MLKGTLDDFTLPEIFRLMSLARKTGKLDVTRSAGTGTVFFRDGDVYYAESSVAREPLGQKLIRAGHLTESQLIKALDEHASSGVRVGEVLVARGSVTEEQLQRAVQEQIEDAVFDLLRWDLGEFSWEGGVIADVEVPIQVSGENLIMEASRKLDELESILRKIPSENAILAMAATPPEGAVEIRFTPEEWRLLVLVDARRTVHEIAAIADLDDLSALKAFYGVVSAGLVEVIDPGVPVEEPAAPEAAAIEEIAAPEAVAEPEAEAVPEPEPQAEVVPEPEPEAVPEPEPAAVEPVPEPEPEPEPLEEEPAPAASVEAETLAGEEEPPEEVLAEPEPRALAEMDVVDLPELDILTEEPVAPQASAPEAPVQAAADGAPAPPEESAWEGFAPEAFDAPAPEELSTETPTEEPSPESPAEDPFLSDLLGGQLSERPAPEPPVAGPRPAAPPAPEPAPEPPAAEAPAEPEAPEVDRAAVVRELAGLFDDDIEERSGRPSRPPARKEEPQDDGAPEDDRKRVEDDDQVTRGLISRLIDGVKGL